jgi:hypothetical protein
MDLVPLWTEEEEEERARQRRSTTLGGYVLAGILPEWSDMVRPAIRRPVAA